MHRVLSLILVQILVVPEGFSPLTLLDIKYSSGEDVALGNFIKPSDSAEAPKVNFIAPDKDSQYTLLMVTWILVAFFAVKHKFLLIYINRLILMRHQKKIQSYHPTAIGLLSTFLVCTQKDE